MYYSTYSCNTLHGLMNRARDENKILIYYTIYNYNPRDHWQTGPKGVLILPKGQRCMLVSLQEMC